jgi:hypothetical protein
VLLTRSPLEYPRKGLSVRLACVKHAASVRPEPGSNSPNKNIPHPKRAQENSNQNNPITAKRHQKLASKKQNHTPTREVKAWPKTTTKQNHQTHY